VHDDIAEVQQHPPQIAFAFAPERPQPESAQRRIHGFYDRPHMTFGIARTDHEEVGYDDQLRDVEDADVERLLVLGRSRRGDGGSDRFDGTSARPCARRVAFRHEERRSFPTTTVTSTDVCGVADTTTVPAPSNVFTCCASASVAESLAYTTICVCA
jgi:hypothetical protein